MTGVPIFVTHTRGDIVYDRARLDLIALNTAKSDRIKGRPKVIVHHSGDFTGPNVGRLSNVRRVEDLLFADYVNLRPAVFMNWVKDGYPGRSVQLDPVTFDRIEAIAFLGDEEPYFPLSPVDFDLSEDEMNQLAADVDADRSFAHAYARPAKSPKKSPSRKGGEKSKPKLFMRREEVKRLAAALLADTDADEIEVSELFKRTGNGALAKFMMEPEDAQDVIAVTEELTAPLKEGLAMMNARLEAVEQQMDLQEAKDDGADDGDEDEEETGDEDEPDFTADEDDADADSERDDEEGEEDSEREDDDTDGDEDSEREDEEEDDMSKRTRAKGKPAPSPARKGAGSKKPAKSSDLATFERLVKAEAKNARHKGEETFNDYKRRIVEVLDPAIEPDPEAKAEELTDELYKLSEADRPKGLELLLNAYQQSGVPTGKLPKTKGKSKPAQGLEQRAREYHREWKRVQGKNYMGKKEDDFVKLVQDTVEEDETGTRFAFLRD